MTREGGRPCSSIRIEVRQPQLLAEPDEERRKEEEDDGR